MLAGDYVVDAESTLGSKAGAGRGRVGRAGEGGAAEAEAGAVHEIDGRSQRLERRGDAGHDEAGRDLLHGRRHRVEAGPVLPVEGHDAGGLPVVLYVHGGQLISGTKNAPAGSPAGTLLPAATARGYAFVSIDYRLAPANKWPAQIEDAKSAIRYLRANAPTLGIDADRIGIIGSSSGGTLVSLMGVTDAGAGMEGHGGYDGVSSRVHAVVDEFGANIDLRVPPFSQAETVSRLQAYVQPPTQDLVRSATVVNHVTRRRSTVPDRARRPRSVRQPAAVEGSRRQAAFRRRAVDAVGRGQRRPRLDARRVDVRSDHADVGSDRPDRDGLLRQVPQGLRLRARSEAAVSAGDERAVLVRAAAVPARLVVRKVQGVDDAAARRPMVESGTSLMWLVKHLTFAETIWFVQRFAGEDVVLPDATVRDDDTVDAAVDLYRSTWQRVDAIVAVASLDDPCVNAPNFPPLDLRWVLAPHARGDRAPRGPRRHPPRTDRRRDRPLNPETGGGGGSRTRVFRALLRDFSERSR